MATIWFKDEKERKEAYAKAKDILQKAGCTDNCMRYFFWSDSEVNELVDEEVHKFLRDSNRYLEVFDVSTVGGVAALMQCLID